MIYLVGLAIAFIFGCLIGNAWCQVKGANGSFAIDVTERDIFEPQQPPKQDDIDWSKVAIHYPLGGGNKWN